jgi:hypothetical protein
LDRVLANPHEAGRLGQLLAAAGAPAGAGWLPGEDVARGAFRVAFPVPAAPKARILARMSGRAAAVALCGGLVLTGGAAAAAVGALPGPAQQTAKGVLAKLGVNIPGPHEHATVSLGVHHARFGKGVQKPVATAEPTATPRVREPSATGNEVSALARSTTLTGVAKGAAVSGLASNGKSQAGQHGKPASSANEKAKKSHKSHAKKHHERSTHKPKPKSHAAAPVAHPTGTGHSSSKVKRP